MDVNVKLTVQWEFVVPDTVIRGKERRLGDAEKNLSRL